MISVMRATILLLFLSGCSSIRSECDYDLAKNGWLSVSAPPADLVTGDNKGYEWFSNDEGDYFACPSMVTSDVCGPLYEIYEKQADGSYEYDFILCIQ